MTNPTTPQARSASPDARGVRAPRWRGSTGGSAADTGPDMTATHPEFSDRTLADLLRALHARTTGHPDNPGLIACLPGVRQARMAAACAELRRRGHPVYLVPIEGVKSGQTRDGWAIAAPTDEPVSRL